MNIFISYSRNDLEIVRTIVSFLNLNHACWYDKDIKTGAKWWPAILDHIENTDVFIYIFSKNSFESRACFIERNYANELGKNTITFKIDDVNNQLLPKDISHNQFLLWSNDAITATQINKRLQEITPTEKEYIVSVKRPSPPPNYVLNDVLTEILSNAELTKRRENEIMDLLSRNFLNAESKEICSIVASKLLDQSNIQAQHLQMLKKIAADNLSRNSESLRVKIEDWFTKNKYSYKTISTSSDSMVYVLKKKGILKHFKTPLAIQVRIYDIESNIKTYYNLVRWDDDNWIGIGSITFFSGGSSILFAKRFLDKTKDKFNTFLEVKAHN